MSDQIELVSIKILHTCKHIESHEFDIDSEEFNENFTYEITHPCSVCEDIAREKASDLI